MLTRAISGWEDTIGFSYTLEEGESPADIACLHFTEQWIAVIYLMANLLDLTSALNFHPRGIHRTNVALP